MMRLNVDEKQADKRFVHYWLQGEIIRDFIQRNAKGTSPTMKKISQRVVLSIPFPVSLPLEQQRSLVEIMDWLQAKINILQAKQAQTTSELDALLPSILDRAFRGELA